MIFAGFVKNTLLDYPGRVASTVFTGGCDLRCIFCHNPHLMEQGPSIIPEDEILSYMRKRQGLIDALCISGGEPTMQADLIPFLKRAREVVRYIKLDTNGTRPDILREVSHKSLADYVAMDIKTDRKRYPEICGVGGMQQSDTGSGLTGMPGAAGTSGTGFEIEKIDESIDLIMGGAFPGYEFRTTVVAEYYDEDVASAVGTRLQGAERYALQYFEDGDDIPAGRGILHKRSRAEMESYAAILRQYVKEVVIRGGN